MLKRVGWLSVALLSACMADIEGAEQSAQFVGTADAGTDADGGGLCGCGGDAPA